MIMGAVILELIANPEHFSPDRRSADSALVAVCVCTYKRPESLRRCLKSLARQRAPEHVRHQLIVVDNDEECSAMPVVRMVRSDAIYLVEPRRGIATARNRAIRTASQLGADWVAFIDDDEIADDHWLQQLMAPDYNAVPILRGHRVLRLPVAAPFWAAPVKPKTIAEGTLCHTAYTNNVRFSRALIDCGLRFDEAFAFSGGEDVDFFSRARKRGFEIRHTARAITYETIHVERLTYRRQCTTSFWVAAANIRESMTRRGTLRTLLTKLHTIPLNLIIGPALILASPVALVAGLDAFKKLALAGGDKIARAAGRFAALMGYMPAPYLHTDGD